MRVGTAALACLVICSAVAAFAGHEASPKRFVVHGGSDYVGVLSSADPSAYIISHGATVQAYPTRLALSVDAHVRNIPGATLRYELADYPDEGGQVSLDGRSSTTLRRFNCFNVDRLTLYACMLGVRSAPDYTLEYTTPWSPGWRAVVVAALAAGPLLAGMIWAAGLLLRRAADARRGFDVLRVDRSGGRE